MRVNASLGRIWLLFLGWQPALAATGFIWVRYSLVITPINYSLAAVRTDSRSSLAFDSDMGGQVNFFVGSTGLGQLGRIW